MLCVCVRVSVCENCPARESQNELELTRGELERKQQEVHNTASRETHDELQQKSLQVQQGSRRQIKTVQIIVFL